MVADVGSTGDRAIFGPFVEEALLVTVDRGDALEATHVGGGVLKSEDPLQLEWDIRVQVDVGVPVDEARLVVIGLIGPDRRLQRDPVDGDPQLVRAVQVAEDSVDRRVLPDVPHRLIVVHLDHSRLWPDDGRLVPRGGIAGCGPGVAPDVVRDGLQDRWGQAGRHDDVPVRVQGAATRVRHRGHGCALFQPPSPSPQCVLRF
jgi:hypothetical protein